MAVKKVLVTGGAGFIGSHISDLLIEKGYSVGIVDDLSSGKMANVNKKAKFYKIDILKKELNKVFEDEKPDFVVHCAAQISVSKSVREPVLDAERNILCSINLLENCVKYKVKKIIFSSTGGALYGNPKKIPCNEKTEIKPLSPYGVAKYCIEQYLSYYNRLYNLDYVSLRYSNVYGPRQDPFGEAGVVAIFCKKMINGETPIINGDGEQTRDFVFVKDVSNANLLALEKKVKEKEINISAMKETSINEIFGLISAAAAPGIKPGHAPEMIGEVRKIALDNSLAKKELGWSPEMDIKKGIKETFEWFRKNL
ncbi:MAG: NAD-dependent epimerase/dehydratase family protein [Candidatus Woesearchaeota archaeon]|nr:NAD-dependent epimerase/dehydratase family protein [Candidatus Woesearchaeota archaeon]